jgi:hypothetical protein
LYTRHRVFDKNGGITASCQLREAGIEIGQWFKRKGTEEGDEDIVGKLVGLCDESGIVYITVQGMKGKLQISAFLQEGSFKWVKTNAPVPTQVSTPSIVLQSSAFTEEDSRCAVFKAITELYSTHSDMYSKIEVTSTPKNQVTTLVSIPSNKLVLVPATPWVKVKESLGKGIIDAKCTMCPDKFFVLTPRWGDDNDVIPFWYALGNRSETPNMKYKMIKIGTCSVPCLTNPKKLDAGVLLTVQNEVKPKVDKPEVVDIEYIVKRRKIKGPA